MGSKVRFNVEIIWKRFEIKNFKNGAIYNLKMVSSEVEMHGSHDI